MRLLCLGFLKFGEALIDDLGKFLAVRDQVLALADHALHALTLADVFAFEGTHLDVHKLRRDLIGQTGVVHMLLSRGFVAHQAGVHDADVVLWRAHERLRVESPYKRLLITVLDT